MKVVQSCSTVCDLMDRSLPSSSVYEILQARIWAWVAVTFSRGSFQPRDWTQISLIACGFFTIWATRESIKIYYYVSVYVVCFIYVDYVYILLYILILYISVDYTSNTLCKKMHIMTQLIGSLIDIFLENNLFNDSWAACRS